MAPGFLTTSTLNEFHNPRSAECHKCGLFSKCNSPKMSHSGKGKKDILVVAEAPGRAEDKHGTQLIGDSGKLLRKALRLFDVSLDEDCWKTNAVVCYPGRTPSEREIQYCFPNLKGVVEELQPTIILVLGRVAAASLLSWLWRPKIGAIGRWVGWKIPSQKINAWICPTYHPSYLLRKNSQVLAFEFERHLEEALVLEGRPWTDLPDYASEVEVVMDCTEAAEIVRGFTAAGGTAAWDLETNMLKPDSAEARIICCSICWEGKRTIAFPWVGEVVEAMKGFLTSSIKKIAANLKFEHRWIKAVLGIDVENWHFDTMQTAHVLDNRKGITGLKFQSFVSLGQGVYDEHIGPFLGSPNSNKPNKVTDVDLSELLLYCGLDSLLTYKLAGVQRDELLLL